LKTLSQIYEENSKVVAARSHPATRGKACRKMVEAPSYSIGFGSFQLPIEANVAGNAKIEKNQILKTLGQRYEENTKVVAARSHPATRGTACSKMVEAPSYSIGFGGFQLPIEANVASYAKI
jgi:hydrogenase/urease accessory protein HupE